MMTPNDSGRAISSGTRYPGTTRPDSTHPKRRLKKVMTKTPTQTVVTTELARLPSGKIGSGNSASNTSGAPSHKGAKMCQKFNKINRLSHSGVNTRQQQFCHIIAVRRSRQHDHPGQRRLRLRGL